jgi:glycosyltransferase involved in cell wall biosynthesis
VINFISNLPRDLRTGGFSAMNAAACTALERRCEVAFVGPIDPPVGIWRKGLSKALRRSGLGGDFAAYGEGRLAQIAREVDARSNPKAELDFFHGFTPWISYQPPRPYVAWSDCTFHDYMDIFHDRARFSAADLERIERRERIWLQRANRVLFTSAWAAERATSRYQLDPERVTAVGIFGEFEQPGRDSYEGAQRFAFVSTDFARKGGPTVLQAFQDVRETHPAAELVIIGSPPEGPASGAGVHYAGFLRKESPEERDTFGRLLASSAALVHPTTSDISPLILVEAAMCGCPAISTRAFAIPEMVDDGVSGILLDPPPRPDEVARAMRRILDQQDGHGRMREAARERAIGLHSKAAFEARLSEAVFETLARSGAEAA